MHEESARRGPNTGEWGATPVQKVRPPRAREGQDVFLECGAWASGRAPLFSSSSLASQSARVRRITCTTTPSRKRCPRRNEKPAFRLLASWNCGYSTGVRRNTSAEDLLAFARGFAYAGARSLLMPLWHVPDECTGELLANFYERYEGGKSRPEAFVEAMNSIRATHPHPYFWGSFLLFGQ